MELSNGPRVFGIEGFRDPRGTFQMTFQHSVFATAFPQLQPVMQTNFIVGNTGAIRGFHGAVESNNHWKIVTCIKGNVINAFIDIRPNSLTFGEVAVQRSNGSTVESIVIPPGFAYAVQFVEQDSFVSYSTNIEYKSQFQISISPISAGLSAIWHDEFILSEKDEGALSISQLLNDGTFNQS